MPPKNQKSWKKLQEGDLVNLGKYGSGVVKGWLSSSIITVKLDRGGIIHAHYSIAKERDEECK